MTSEVLNAFEVLIASTLPSRFESEKAKSHRASIDSCLKANFGMTNFFRAGSFGHGTSVRGISDVDYFAVIPAENLSANSSTCLRELKQVLWERFPRTDIRIDSPAVAVKFGNGTWEKHEITPVNYLSSQRGFDIYEMPDREGGWMISSPTGLNYITNRENDRLGKRAKQLVRLIKLWNYVSGARIRSIYLEMRVIEYLSSEFHLHYPSDVCRSLQFLLRKQLASMRDPLGLCSNILPCRATDKANALSRLATAVARAEKAIEAEEHGYSADAFDWWNKLFFGCFPRYHR